jgi:hypothetical protein
MSEPKQCKYVDRCPMFPKFKLKGALAIWKDRYCLHESHHTTCARFKLAESGTKPPGTLLPNGEHIQED